MKQKKERKKQVKKMLEIRWTFLIRNEMVIDDVKFNLIGSAYTYILHNVFKQRHHLRIQLNSFDRLPNTESINTLKDSFFSFFSSPAAIHVRSVSILTKDLWKVERRTQASFHIYRNICILLYSNIIPQSPYALAFNKHTF